MKSPYDILIRPVITEKSGKLSKVNWYAFMVAKEANKFEIKQAVEQVYNVKVEKVRTCIFKGKRKLTRSRILMGKRADRKKAYVKLAEGHKISII